MWGIRKPKGLKLTCADQTRIRFHTAGISRVYLCSAPSMGTEQALQHSARCFLSLLRDVQTAAARRPRPSRGASVPIRPSEQLTLEIEQQSTAARHMHGSHSESESRPLLPDACAGADGVKAADKLASMWQCVTRLLSLARLRTKGQHITLMCVGGRFSGRLVTLCTMVLGGQIEHCVCVWCRQMPGAHRLLRTLPKRLEEGTEHLLTLGREELHRLPGQVGRKPRLANPMPTCQGRPERNTCLPAPCCS